VTGWATALYIAADEGHEAVTKQLIAAKCDINLQSKNGHTALHIAAMMVSSKVIQTD